MTAAETIVTDEQKQEVSLAAFGVADRATKIAAFPWLINDPLFMDSLKKDMQRIEAVAYEIDQVNCHDDCTAVSDNLKNAA